MINILMGLFLIFSICFSNLESFAGVYDGGLYSKEKMPLSLENQGGKLGKHLPSVVSVFEDRETFAPVNTPLFVLDIDEKCYWGQFSSTEGPKKLIIYSKSPVSADHCIYQKTFDQEPQGFSILTEDGGTCHPTYSDSLAALNESLRGSLHIVNKEVSMSHCVEQTVSFGAILEKRTNEAKQQVAQISLPRAPSSVSPLPVLKAKFSIQLSSHTTLKIAEEKILAYKDHGIPAFYTTGVVDGKTWFRVCTGRFTTKKEAIQFRNWMITKKGLVTSFIIKLDPINISSSAE